MLALYNFVLFEGMKSPYYNQSHVQFRQALRIWLDENIRPQAETMEKSGKLSKKFLKKCCDVTTKTIFFFKEKI